MHVNPVVGADWLLRSLLPTLLDLAAAPYESDSLRLAAPKLSGSFALDSLGDRYAASRFASKLVSVREDLSWAIRMEGFSRDTRTRVIEEVGGFGPLRRALFPELDSITGMVARTLTVKRLGELIRQCVNASILLALLRDHDEREDHDVSALSVALPVIRAYREEFRELEARCNSQRAPTVHPFRARPTRSEKTGAKGFRGEFDSLHGTVACSHVHKKSQNARDCAQRLSEQTAANTSA